MVAPVTWEDAAQRFKPDLLRWVEELAQDPSFSQATTGGRDRDRLGDNQWRGLVAAAREAQVMAELKALILYKVGKDVTGQGPKGWATPLSDGRHLGHAVVDILDQIEQKALQWVQGEEAQRLALDAAARFFGYVAWKVVSLRAQRGGAGG